MLNSTNLIGRLTRDVEIKTVGEGISKGTFTLAVSRSYVSKGEEKPKCDFIPVVVWRGQTTTCGMNFVTNMVSTW